MKQKDTSVPKLTYSIFEEEVERFKKSENKDKKPNIVTQTKIFSPAANPVCFTTRERKERKINDGKTNERALNHRR